MLKLQVHKYLKRCRGADVQPVGERRRVTERAHPQAVAHCIPDVMCRHGHEKHPWQGAPSIFETSDPHEEAEGETEDGDERGAVQGRTLGQRDGSLKGNWESSVGTSLLTLLILLLQAVCYRSSAELYDSLLISVSPLLKVVKMFIRLHSGPVTMITLSNYHMIHKHTHSFC